MSGAVNIVFDVEDLRRYIFGFLRSKARHRCDKCLEVCVWDRKTIKQYIHNNRYTWCTECYWKYFNNPGCILA